MDHEEARDLFSDHLDGELGEERAEALKEHLDGCAECREELERLRQTMRVVSGLHRLPPPGEFVDRVEQKIRRRSRGRFYGPESALSRFPFEWISLAIILFVALAIYLFSVLDWKVTPPEEIGAPDGSPGDARPTSVGPADGGKPSADADQSA
jgi:anti-sigma factor RsiW